jgi:hypothetical protein
MQLSGQVHAVTTLSGRYFGRSAPSTPSTPSSLSYLSYVRFSSSVALGTGSACRIQCDKRSEMPGQSASLIDYYARLSSWHAEVTIGSDMKYRRFVQPVRLFRISQQTASALFGICNDMSYGFLLDRTILTHYSTPLANPVEVKPDVR